MRSCYGWGYRPPRHLPEPCRASLLRVPHQREVDLEALVDAGRGDVPLIKLRFRCSHYASRLTDFVVTTKNTGPRGRR